MESKLYPQGSGAAVKPRHVNGVLVMPGIPRQLRRRCTAAEINAGVSLLPALPGFAYRMLDMAMIAIGGAATTATDVRLLGTRAASSAALLIAAVAALTQSAVAKPGLTTVSNVSGATTVLADGASYTPLDPNTAVTAGKTGGSLAGATHVDVILTYVAE